MRYITVFILGAFGYTILEIIWRGYSHWTMTVTGGFCMTILFLLNESVSSWDLSAKCFVGCILITSVELVVGILVNLILKWNVWDYSSIPMNFMGQICFPYTVLWYFLCIPVMWICTRLDRIF